MLPLQQRRLPIKREIERNGDVVVTKATFDLGIVCHIRSGSTKEVSHPTKHSSVGKRCHKIGELRPSHGTGTTIVSGRSNKYRTLNGDLYVRIARTSLTSGKETSALYPILPSKTSSVYGTYSGRLSMGKEDIKLAVFEYLLRRTCQKASLLYIFFLSKGTKNIKATSGPVAISILSYDHGASP
eukprot:scaffold37482_cov206-Amphora_coffeaeformis.AAC.1